MSDELLEVVCDARRRRVLYELLDAEGEAAVAVPEGVVPGSAGRDDRILFEHVHLPKLADAGLITWDREAGTVGRGPAFDEVRPLLEALEQVVEED
ncbi:DUF7344 domain-containing protein [Halobaculum sp. EA56]|uniref:DUF7344 domain-containing protein n=1 Tax=Halobaculum sp. EA56 TaxID=3421648 RepID=UPI003EBD909C